jgi:hypothetical protein
MDTAHRFMLDVPELWDELDPDGEQLAKTRVKVLTESGSPRDAARITAMFRQSEQINRAAHAHGAQFAAGTAALYGQSLFMACAMVFAVTAADGEQELPTLSARFGLSSADAVPPKDRVVSSVRVPRVGTVPRLTETARSSAEVGVDLLTMHTMMPVPAAPDEFLVVTLASPNLVLAEDVYGLFDAITRTFRFTAAGSEQPDQPGRTMRSATTPW